MQAIKLYAWANAYIVKLRAVRNDEELNAMRKERVLGATFNILFSLPRYLVAAATFAVYSYFVPERPLTSDIIFPALALFNILNFSLGIFPMLINFYVQGKVASGRLVEMYTSEQLQPDAVERKPRGDGPELVSVSGASFSPSSKDEKVLVEVEDFSTSAGELNCIIGQVGSGKSSLLNAILGNLHKTKGTVSVYGRVSYVPQTAWVMNATIKENIIFGRPFDGGLYNKTLKNCALLPDLASLTDGDQTEVGEKGISLSGGQKARLSLARAVYSQSDVYIMDDCLSAVDEHVSKALIENVIGPNGMLKDAARVLATNSTRVLKSANTIHYLQDGIVKEHGSYEKLMSDRGSVYDLVNTLIEQQQQNGDSSGSGSKTPLITIEETEGSSTAASSSPPQSLAAEVAEALVQVSETVTIAEGAQADKAIQVMTEADVADTTPLLSAGGTADISGKDPEAAAEEVVIDSLAKRKVEKSEEGQVSWSVYLEYAKAARPVIIVLWALAVLAEMTMSLCRTMLKQDRDNVLNLLQ
jgi:ATP-binding cassette subfamily C (CFTR/MRP) protein 1